MTFLGLKQRLKHELNKDGALKVDPSDKIDDTYMAQILLDWPTFKEPSLVY